jgi:hypothetical protein
VSALLKLNLVKTISMSVFHDILSYIVRVLSFITNISHRQPEFAEMCMFLSQCGVFPTTRPQLLFLSRHVFIRAARTPIGSIFSRGSRSCEFVQRLSDSVDAITNTNLFKTDKSTGIAVYNTSAPNKQSLLTVSSCILDAPLADAVKTVSRNNIFSRIDDDFLKLFVLNNTTFPGAMYGTWTLTPKAVAVSKGTREISAFREISMDFLLTHCAQSFSDGSAVSLFSSVTEDELKWENINSADVKTTQNVVRMHIHSAGFAVRALTHNEQSRLKAEVFFYIVCVFNLDDALLFNFIS